MDDYVRIVVESMRRRGLRSWLTILGIVIGVAAIVALITVSSGFRFAVEHQFDAMGLSNIRVVPANLMGPPAGDVGLPRSYIGRVESLRTVDYANPVLLDLKPVEYGNEEVFTWVSGYDTELSGKGFVDLDVTLAEGRMLKPGERTSAIVGHKLATEAFGKEVRLRSSLSIEGTAFEVVGIFEEMGTGMDNNVYIPLEAAEDLFGRHDTVNVITVRVKEGIPLSDGERELEHEFRSEMEDDKVDIFTPEQLLRQFTQILDIVQFVLVGIAAISLVVGAVGIMNSMFTSVLERTRDIGVMKAIGATNRHILVLFLIEAGIIGAVGGLLGLLIGSGIAGLINVAAAFAGFAWLRIRVQLGVVLFALGFSFVIGAASGLLPALRAARLNPVDALRYE